MIKTAPIKTEIIGEDRLSKQLDQAQKRAKKFSQSMAKLGSNLTKYVSVPLAGAGVASVKFAIDLNKSMANIATLLPKNEKAVHQLKKEIQDLSVETGTSTDDLASGMYDVISAFGDTAEKMDTLRIANKAAIAGMSTTKEAVNFLSTATKGYNLTSAEMISKFSDLAFLTVKMGVTTFPELAASMGKVIPLAGTLNVKEEELFGTMATLTGVTGNTAEVSTQLASIFSAMLTPTKDMQKMVKKLGFESASAMVKQIGLRESLIRLSQASGGISELNKEVKKLGFSSVEAMVKELGFEEATNKLSGALKQNDDALAKLFGRKEGLIASLALLGSQSENYKNKLKDMNGWLGKSQEAYDKVDKGINKTGRSWDKTRARLMIFAQRVGDKLLPVLERLFAKIEPWLVKLEKMDDATLEWGIKLAGIAIAAGPVIAALGKLNTGTLALLKLFSNQFKATGVIRGLDQIGGAAGRAGTKVGKLGRLLGGLGLAGEALAIGVGAGTAISEFWEQPRARKKFKQEETILRRRQQAEIALKKGMTIEEKTKMAAQLEKDMMNLGDSMTSIGADLHWFSTVFTGEKSWKDRYVEEWTKIRDVRQKLLESAQMDIKQLREEGVFGPKTERTEKIERTEKTVNIKFQADVPGSVKVKSTEQRLTPAQTGAIMGTY